MILINVCRGALVDTVALIEALKTGQVGGVGLDVYEEEEGKFFEDLSGEVMADDVLARLMTFPNVIVTAHQAFLTKEALDEIARVTTENIVAFSNGRVARGGADRHAVAARRASEGRWGDPPPLLRVVRRCVTVA